MNLNINYQETRNTGTSVLNQAGEFKTLLENIKAINNELKDYWQGADATKYSGAVDEQAQYMQKLADTVEEIGGFLIKVGDAYEQAMQQNSDAIK